MSLDVLSHFGVLDELIQIIYGGVERFVLLSKVDYETWTVYLGLQGPEGRWWRGCWSEKDILSLTVGFCHSVRFCLGPDMWEQGSKASEAILEGFADKLADIIVKGLASIGDWSSESGAKINVNLAERLLVVDANTDNRVVFGS
jgi:hypothetical protein